jgi:hypothetical protein
MKRPMGRTVFASFLIVSVLGQTPTERRLSSRDYFDKVHGGWVGKAIGLVVGVPKEYSEPWPPSESEGYAQVPTHFSDYMSGDDVYLPLVNQLALKRAGIQATMDQYMREWAARLFSGRVWVSAVSALDLYYAGMAPPKTGTPGYNPYWDDMCAQISTDNFGWSAPGLVNTAAELADRASHLCNWGLGADGGVFTAALASEAFFTTDIEALVRRARAVLPSGSQYGEMVDEAIRLRRTEPDWRMARQLLARKYNPNLDPGDDKVIAATGIGTVIGLLYGEGDFGKSMSIARKCRWDSDCTAATSAGIIGTVLGYSRIELRWTLPLQDTYENFCIKGLPRWLTFSDIARDTVDIGEKVIRANGGRTSGQGDDRVFWIPVQEPRPLARREHATPELIAQGEKDMARFFKDKLKGLAEAWDPAWTLTMASFETRPELLASYMGRTRVLRVQPGPRGAVLERTLSLEPGRHHFLRIGVAHHPNIISEATGQPEVGSWNLEVLADGKKIGEYKVSSQAGVVVWEDPQFDLTPYAGKTVKMTLTARQGAYEFTRVSTTSYWSGISLISLDKLEPWR